MNGSGAMKPGPTAYSAEVRLERKAGGKVAEDRRENQGSMAGDVPMSAGRRSRRRGANP